MRPGLVIALASVACGPDRREPPPPVVEAPQVVARPPSDKPPRAWSSTGEAEDAFQLTPDEKDRYDRLVEGTSPIAACNDLIRIYRRMSTCTTFPPQMRTMMQRAALMIGEDLGKDGTEGLAETCARSAAQLTKTIADAGC